MRRGRLLIVTWDGGGNVPPALAIGRRLAGRGHQVRILASRSLEETIESNGLSFRAFEQGPEWGSHLRRKFDSTYLLAVQCGPGVGSDLEAELAKEPADVLLIDFMLFGALATAERSGLPTAGLAHTLYQPNREGGEGAIWDDNDLARVNQTRRGLGLSSIASGSALWDALALLIVLTPMAFDRPATALPAGVQYVGPIFDRPAAAGWDLPWPADHPDPLVLVSFSTTYMSQEPVLQRVLDAIEGMPVRALVTTSSAIDTDGLTAGANTVIRSYIDHQAVLPHALAVVTHAGHSTVMAALMHGVPLLCLPMGRDQFANAKRVEGCGAGRALDQDATVEQISAALIEVLDRPAYRREARRMADLMARDANGARVVPLLEGLLVDQTVR